MIPEIAGMLAWTLISIRLGWSLRRRWQVWAYRDATDRLIAMGEEWRR